MLVSLTGIEHRGTGRRSWKEGYVGVSTASNVAVVMAFLFGHVDSEERAVGGTWCWWRFSYDSSQIVFRWPDSRIVGRGAKVSPSKVLHALCRQLWWCLWVLYSLGGTIMDTLAKLGLRVKPFTFLVSTTPLVLEIRFPSGML